MKSIAILVVEDEESVRTCVAEFLENAGYQVRTAADGAEALETLSGGAFDAVLLDVVMPGISGLEVLKRFRSVNSATPVIVLSALSGADDAVRAMKLGATDYLSKPFNQEDLEEALSRALKAPMPPANGASSSELPAETVEPIMAQPEERFDAHARQLISISAAMRRARDLAERLADSDIPVLILGESGTGKEVIAREIHYRSRRRNQPFLKVNCAALPSELLESELFGHERGAFTGATAEKPGKFELADRGTIFLDEIGDMAIRLQAKLLQVLQDEEFFRVGGKKSVKVDARVVVATNRELDREIEAGNFREDLYYRLNVVAIRLAPLRERREDIVPLVDYFLKYYGRRYQHGMPQVPAEVLQAFREYEWPGNVRELENMVRRLVVLRDPVLVLDELRQHNRQPAAGSFRANSNPFNMPQPPPPAPALAEGEMSLKEIGKRAAMLAEREAILAMLQRTAWNKRKAAGKLRISYKALLYKIKESGIVDPRSSAEF